MGLTLTLKYGQEIMIGEAKVSVEQYSSNQIRVKIEAPKEIKIVRSEKKKKITAPEFLKLDKDLKELIIKNIQKLMSEKMKAGLQQKASELQVSEELSLSVAIIKDNFKPTFKDRKWLTR